MNQSALIYCEGCGNPNGGIYLMTCRGCQIRDLARGHLFFDAMRRGAVTGKYKKALRELGDVAAVHDEVKAEAKKYNTGARP